MALVVKKKPGESDDNLIKRFNQQAKDEDIVRRARDLKEHTSEQEKRKAKKERLKYLRKQESKRSKQYS